MKKIIYILNLVLFYTGIALSSIKTQNFVDKNEVFLGDIIKYTIIIDYKENLQFDNFDVYDILKDTSGIENFVIYEKKIEKLKKSKDRIILKYIFHLIPIKLGDVTINELKIRYVNNDTKEENILTLPKIEIKVKPYPKPKGKKFDGEIVDIKDQIWIKNYFLIFIIILVTIAGATYFLIKSKNRKQYPTIADIPQIDIKELALKRLNELLEKKYLDFNLVKEFYLELTGIVRWYIEQKYNVNALELTTEELFVALKSKVDKNYNIKLKTFLESADLAKFAKYVPDKQQILKDFETAKELILK